MKTEEAPAERAQSAASAPMGPAPGDEHPVAGADAGTLDAVCSDRRWLDERALSVRHLSGSRTIWYSATVASSPIPPQGCESPTQPIVAHRCCSPRWQ